MLMLMLMLITSLLYRLAMPMLASLQEGLRARHRLRRPSAVAVAEPGDGPEVDREF